MDCGLLNKDWRYGLSTKDCEQWTKDPWYPDPGDEIIEHRLAFLEIPYLIVILKLRVSVIHN